jgi:hypothetical protein
MLLEEVVDDYLLVMQSRKAAVVVVKLYETAKSTYVVFPFTLL